MANSLQHGCKCAQLIFRSEIGPVEAECEAVDETPSDLASLR